jgi:hypothetical protein
MTKIFPPTLNNQMLTALQTLGYSGERQADPPNPAAVNVAP